MRGLMALAGFEIVRMVRNARFVFFSMALPLGFYMIFASIYGRYSVGGVGMTAYDMVSMGAFAGLSAALGPVATRVAAERAGGFTALLRVSPLRPGLYLVAKYAAALAAAAPGILLVMAAARLVHGVALGPAQWIEVFAWLWLGVLPFAALGLLLGYLLDGESSYVGAMAAYFFLAFAGGLWVPLPVLPRGFAAVGRLLPSYHYAALAWGVVGGARRPLEHAAVMLGYLALFGILAAWRYRVDGQRGLA